MHVQRKKQRFEFVGEVRELTPDNNDEVTLIHERGYVTEEFFVQAVLHHLDGKKVRLTIQEV